MNKPLSIGTARVAANDVGADELLTRYRQVRDDTISLTSPLALEDFGLQAMPEVSPPKWHMAHTTWFFETFLLKPFVSSYRPFHPRFEYLFNSYYNAVGEQFPRAERGLLSRPTLEEVQAYRQHVDHQMQALLEKLNHPQRATILSRTMLGLHHEQQHQELLCTDIKYSFSRNPLYPSLSTDEPPRNVTEQPFKMISIDGHRATIGHQDSTFHFDNEAPAHDVELPAFLMANRLVTNAEYLEFVNNGGYWNPSLWLADGWTWNQQQQAQHPLYWQRQPDGWMEYTLHGLIKLNPLHPVVHINFYEADAYARWRHKRLPTEFEWEAACRFSQSDVPAMDSITWHPGVTRHASATPESGFLDWYGKAWQWTQSGYTPYPRYKPAAGAIGEYNGKFMCNQMVLRGSSCVTPPGHARVSYRNFFYPNDQWQFSGIRLAEDAP